MSASIRSLHLVLCGALVVVASSCAKESQLSLAPPDEGKVTREPGRVEILSPIYTIDRIYKSMTGPWSDRTLSILDTATPELVWVTGCHVEMVGPDGETHMPEQFMCHANVDFDADWHNDLFRAAKPLDGRFFTLSQGQLDVQFPPGFGVPMLSSEPLTVSTQVLNLNVKGPPFQVRHKVHIDFVRDADLKSPMTPLYECGVAGMVSLEGRELVFDQADGSGAHAHDEHAKCKSCCVPGAKAIAGYENNDALGRRFTTHWIVPPGREVNRTRATTMLNLPFDTKIHYIAVHMHPFAESLELRDVTADKSLFKSQVQNLKGQIGLAHVDAFESPEGVPVYKDHEYELVSTYNNTTDANQDSMAVMYVYLADAEFRRPDPNLSHVERSADEQALVEAIIEDLAPVDPAGEPAAAAPAAEQRAPADKAPVTVPPGTVEAKLP